MPLHLIFFKTQQSETNLFIKKKRLLLYMFLALIGEIVL